MNNHYILVFQSKIVAECAVPLDSTHPHLRAHALFRDIRHEFPGSAIFLRLGHAQRPMPEPGAVRLVP